MIGIVTDSMSCLTEQDCITYNVELVRAKCIINSKAIPDTVGEYAGAMSEARTAPPSSADYYKTFAKLTSEGVDILCITTSAKVSMSYANACIAARAVGNSRIAIIDSGATAGALYLLIRTCRELEESGAGFGDIVSIISNQKRNLNISFSMKDLSSIIRSGKLLSPSAYIHVPIMDQRPVCTFEGGGKLVLKETAAGSLNELRALVSEHHSPRRIVVHYSESDMHLYELTSMLRRRFPNADIIKRKVSLTVRTTMGEGILGVFSYGLREKD